MYNSIEGTVKEEQRNGFDQNLIALPHWERKHLELSKTVCTVSGNYRRREMSSPRRVVLKIGFELVNHAKKSEFLKMVVQPPVYDELAWNECVTLYGDAYKC